MITLLKVVGFKVLDHSAALCQQMFIPQATGNMVLASSMSGSTF